jgi:glycosyltransferase involved in cell wall biosynthesis
MITQKYTVIVPLYNEEKYLPDFLPSLIYEVKKIPQITCILFINDGSTDSTQNIITKYQSKYKHIDCISFKKNRGKGYSMTQGINRAIQYGSEGVIFMDGDGQHNPRFLSKFVNYLKVYPVVFGYRHLKHKTPVLRKLGNHIATFIIRHIFQIHRHGDILCGYIGLRCEIYSKLRWFSQDYGVEAELSAIIGRKRISFKELLIDTIYLDNNKGVNMIHALRIFVRIPIWMYLHSTI